MSHRRNNSMKYNFNIYGLSGAGTVVDVALVGDPLGGASQVRHFKVIGGKQNMEPEEQRL